MSTQQEPAFRLDSVYQSELISLGERLSAPAHTSLFQRGDAPKGVFILTKGKVRLVAGLEAATLDRICLPGALLGLPATIRNRAYSLTAECLEDCECVRVSHDAFVGYLREHPLFCLRVVEVLAYELGILQNRLPDDRASARMSAARAESELL